LLINVFIHPFLHSSQSNHLLIQHKQDALFNTVTIAISKK
jgi:hypothetical protein